VARAPSKEPEGLNSCPNCDAAAPPGARVCSTCGYRFLEDRRPGRMLLVAAAVAAVVAAAVIVIPGGEDSPTADAEKGRPPDRPRVPTELLSEHPLSAREAERRLEARFMSPGDDDSAAVRWPVRCAGREPRPAHAIRQCRVRYPNGTHRKVVVLLDARGRELLSEF
jgi:predicted nucleic acid-binding Zn ribbon protein